jgi:pullulanase/glycogen debranching enzyme
VVYEVHVKGFTRRHPLVPENVRGTYAGLASSAAIRHLRDLGVTAVELRPIHYHVNDRFLVEAGRTNYWGYNTLGFFAPDPRYAAAGPNWAVEFKSMVRTLHSAGIEVILDVVYNHTAEGNQLGPTLSMRGIDNAAYYRLASDRRQYVDFTGCGNSLNVSHPCVLKLRDLVSYQSKHNEANGENNRDGTDQNNSWNCGVEGSTDDPSINSLRGRQQRNFLATLLLSQGVPMLLAGDELGHTQLGNNNAYCQDSPLTWLNWDLGPDQQQLLEFVRELIGLRTENPVFRRSHFFPGRPIHGRCQRPPLAHACRD